MPVERLLRAAHLPRVDGRRRQLCGRDLRLVVARVDADVGHLERGGERVVAGKQAHLAALRRRRGREAHLAASHEHHAGDALVALDQEHRTVSQRDDQVLRAELEIAGGERR
jgi:hypothetical protein